MSTEPEPADYRDPDKSRSAPVDPSDTDAAADRLAHLLYHESPDGAPVPWFGDRVLDRDGGATEADLDWIAREAERQGHTVQKLGPDALYRWIFPYWERWITGPDPRLTDRSEVTVKRPSEAATNAGRAYARRPNRIRDWEPFIGHLRGKTAEAEQGRFASVRAALDPGDGIAQVFAGAAAEDYRVGLLGTVTTEPGRFDNLLDASEGIYDDTALLRDKIAYDAGTDGRPPGITVAEGTDSGIPHAHPALFGVGRDAIDVEALKDYWAEQRGRGHQVHVYEIRRDPGSTGPLAWEWAGDPPDDANGCPPARYLMQGPRALAAVAANGVDGAPEYAQRRAAFYLASDLKTTNGGTKDLRDAAPDASASDLLPDRSPEPAPSVPPRPRSPRAPRLAAPLAIGIPRASDRPPPC